MDIKFWLCEYHHSTENYTKQKFPRCAAVRCPQYEMVRPTFVSANESLKNNHSTCSNESYGQYFLVIPKSFIVAAQNGSNRRFEPVDEISQTCANNTSIVYPHYFGVSPKISKAVFKIMCEKIKITVIRTTKVLAICLHESIFLEFSTNRPSLLVCGRVIIQEHKLI